MATWYVTISALIRYAKEARAAQERLDEAKQTMKSAAEELCSKWTGDAANAFAQEQGVLDGWFNQLISIGSEYIAAVQQAAEKFRQQEDDLAGKVHG